MTIGKGRFRYAQRSQDSGWQPQLDRANDANWRAYEGGQSDWWDDPLTPSQSPFEPAPWRGSFADPYATPAEPQEAAQPDRGESAPRDQYDPFDQHDQYDQQPLTEPAWETQAPASGWYEAATFDPNDEYAWGADQAYGHEAHGWQHGPSRARSSDHGSAPAQTWPDQTWQDQTWQDQSWQGQSWQTQPTDDGTWYDDTWRGQALQGEQQPYETSPNQTWPEPAWNDQAWQRDQQLGSAWPQDQYQDQRHDQYQDPYQDSYRHHAYQHRAWQEQPQDAWHHHLRATPEGVITAPVPAPRSLPNPTRRAALLGLSGLGFVAIGGASTFGFLSAFRGPAHALGDASGSAAVPIDPALRSTDSPWLKPITRLALEQAETLEYVDKESTFGSTSAPATRRLSLAALDQAADIPPALPLRRASASPAAPLPQGKPASVERQALAWLRANPEPKLPPRAPQPDAASEGSLDAMIARLSQELPAPPKATQPEAVAPEPSAPISAPSSPQILRASTGPKLRNVHNSETILLAHRDSRGRLDPGALRELEVFMRDWRNDETRAMDAGLYDQLSKVASGQELQVISAYRSPQTNAMLRARSGGVAKNSYHLRGQAIDVSPTRLQLEDFYHRALRMNAGGVGYYPGSDFVHIDTGPVREWPARYKARAQAYRKGLA